MPRSRYLSDIPLRHRCLAFLLPILQSIFLGTKHVTVSTKDRDGSSYGLGSLVTPAAIKKVPKSSVMSHVISDTINAKLSDPQPNIWSTGAGTVNVTSLAAVLKDAEDASKFRARLQDVFSSPLPIGTDTGILRNLETRLSTSIGCEVVPHASFPESCTGPHPFQRNFSNTPDSTNRFPFQSTSYPYYKGRLCAPGDILASPWTLATKRQDHYEELWIDFQFTNISDLRDFWENPQYPAAVYGRANFTQHCTSNTTLGYFELPSYWNGHTVGPLLADVLPNTPNRFFNDWEDVDFWTHHSKDPEDAVPGPLLVATLALFGPGTFFDVVVNETIQNTTTESALALEFCHQLRYPFSSLGLGTSNRLADWEVGDRIGNCSNPTSAGKMVYTPVFVQALLIWLTNFASSATTMVALTSTVYSIHRELLSDGSFNAVNSITASPGKIYEKPEISLIPMILISILLAIQLSSLGFLAFYAWCRPAWAETLDSRTIVRIGAEVARRLKTETNPSRELGLGTSRDEMAPLLDGTEGWIGGHDVNSPAVAEEDAQGKGPSTSKDSIQIQKLVFGGKNAVKKGRYF